MAGLSMEELPRQIGMTKHAMEEIEHEKVDPKTGRDPMFPVKM